MNILEFLENSPSGDVYNHLPYIVVDFETTNLDKGDALNEDNRIVLTCYKDNKETKSIWGSEYTLSDLVDKLSDNNNPVVLVAHNAKFELKWLKRAGINLRRVLIWDTMVGEKVLLGNNPLNLPLNLGDIAKRYGLPGKGSAVDSLMKMGVCPSNMPPSLLERRCRYDINVTERIFLKQREIATRDGKLGVMLTRFIFTPVLAATELIGLHLDGDKVEELHKKVQKQYDEVLYEVTKLADINWNSSQQVSEFLYDVCNFKELKKWGRPARTPGGSRKADIATIKALRCTTKKQKKVQGLLLQLSNLNAQLTKGLDKFKACVDNGDYLFANFNQHIAATHRLTSNGSKYKLQLQNLARIFKILFTARIDGWDMVEADGASLEFRGAVEICGDEQGREDLRNPDFEAHRRTASVIFNLEEKDVEYAQRQDAKPHTFKPLFGGGSGTPDEQRYYEDFKKRYKQIADKQGEWKQEALNKKSVKLPWGMEFFFPRTRITRSGYQEDSTRICNYPVQNFSTAEVIPIVLTFIWHRIEHMKTFMVNTVHDSGIYESPPEEKEELDGILIRSFTQSCYNYIKDVYNMTIQTPFGVGIQRGSHWSVGEEQKIIKENDNK